MSNYAYDASLGQRATEAEGGIAFLDPSSPQYNPMQMVFSPIQSTMAIWEFFSSMFLWVTRLSCVPIEMIIRRNFGERHFSLPLYLGGLLWLMLFASGWLNIPQWLGFNLASNHVSNAAIFTVVYLFFVLGFAWHLIFRKWLTKIDLNQYSYCDGQPLFFLYWLPFTKDSNGNPNEMLVRQWYEPLFLVVAGIVIAVIFNSQTGSWLLISAFGMAIKEAHKSSITRNMILDRIDAEIIANNMDSILAGESPKKTQGLYIAGLPTEGKRREKFREIITSRSAFRAPVVSDDTAEDAPAAPPKRPPFKAPDIEPKGAQ